MSEDKSCEEMVRVYRDSAKGDDVIIEILGEPIVALKQMKAEPFALREKGIQGSSE